MLLTSSQDKPCKVGREMIPEQQYSVSAVRKAVSGGSPRIPPICIPPMQFFFYKTTCKCIIIASYKHAKDSRPRYDLRDQTQTQRDG